MVGLPASLPPRSDNHTFGFKSGTGDMGSGMDQLSLCGVLSAAMSRSETTACATSRDMSSCSISQRISASMLARLSSSVALMPAPRAARNAPRPPKGVRADADKRPASRRARAWTLAPRLFADGGRRPRTGRRQWLRAAGRPAALSAVWRVRRGRHRENSRTSHSTPSGGSVSTSVGSISLSQSQYRRA